MVEQLKLSATISSIFHPLKEYSQPPLKDFTLYISFHCIHILYIISFISHHPLFYLFFLFSFLSFSFFLFLFSFPFFPSLFLFVPAVPSRSLGSPALSLCSLSHVLT